MGHHCNFTDRIDLENGELVRIIHAFYNKNKQAEVYKEYENGRFMGRYLYLNNVAGYLVAFPGEKLGYYLNWEEQEEQDFQEYYECNIWCGNHCQIDFDKIIESKPELKYLIKKMDKDITPDIFMKIVKQYKKYPNIESLVEMKLYKLALNNSLQKLSKKKMIEIVNFIKTHRNELNEDTKLCVIEQAIKYNTTIVEAEYYDFCNYNVKLGRYLKEQNKSVHFYRDYIKMCKMQKKNLKDNYWKFPKDLQAAHNKIMNKINAEIASKERAKTKRINDRLKLVAQRVQSNVSNISEYSVYVPSNIEEIRQQADELHQCLISCEYYKKMADNRCILIFIKKGEQRIATAEIDNSKNLKQFYANELNRSDCLPTPEVQSVLAQWLHKMKLSKTI